MLRTLGGHGVIGRVEPGRLSTSCVSLQLKKAEARESSLGNRWLTTLDKRTFTLRLRLTV